MRQRGSEAVGTARPWNAPEAPPGSEGRRRTALAFARTVPFVVCAAASIWQAGRAPAGRRSPRFDWTLDLAVATRALSKVPHMKWMVVLFLLALLAVGMARAGLAAVLTVAVGVGWEVAETTVVGHHAALVDLLPDLVALLAAWLVAAAVGAARSRTGRRGITAVPETPAPPSPDR